jgi:hypothetical protein
MICRYLLALDKHPITTKAVTSAVLTLTGDLICQVTCSCFLLPAFSHPSIATLVDYLVLLNWLTNNEPVVSLSSCRGLPVTLQ